MKHPVNAAQEKFGSDVACIPLNGKEKDDDEPKLKTMPMATCESAKQTEE